MKTSSLLKLLKGLGGCFFTATLAVIPACGSGDLGQKGASNVGQKESADFGEKEAQPAQESKDVAETEQASCALETRCDVPLAPPPARR